jgi:hypothetical protein
LRGRFDRLKDKTERINANLVKLYEVPSLAPEREGTKMVLRVVGGTESRNSHAFPSDIKARWVWLFTVMAAGSVLPEWLRKH